MARRTISKDTIYFKIPTMVLDLVLHCTIFEIILRIMSPTMEAAQTSDIDDFFGLPAVALLIVSYLLSVTVLKIRLHEREISIIKIIVRAVLQTVLTAIVFTTLVALEFKVVPRRFFLFDFSVACVVISSAHVVFSLIIRLMRKMGRNTVRVVMVGADENAIRLYNEMHIGLGVNGYRVLGFFTGLYQDKVPQGAAYLGKISEAADYIVDNAVSEVYCSLSPNKDAEYINEIIKVCESNFISFFYVPNMDGYLHRRMQWSEFGDVTIIQLREEPMNNPVSKALKRGFDIILSLLFLILIYPWVWLIVAIGIKISSPGPILFRQKRTGYTGHDFYCLKFRSMKVNVDSDKIQATANDPRKTKFGDFLRRSSIDELPQFINVLKGDMSIIGPRPHMLSHTDQYSELISDYMVRHLVKPGITGWAQVNGCRGETKTTEDMKRRVENDIWYIEHWSIWLDFEIFFKTIAQIIRGDEQAF